MKLAYGYRALSILILIKNAPFFFKTILFDGFFGKCRLKILFRDDIERFPYFLGYALPTPSLGYRFLLFKYISITHLWTILI